MAQVPHPPAGIAGELARLYDVFVDWDGRLARELPGIERRLAEVGARRVLDAGCGTGRHVRALRECGYDAHGADASADMLAQATAFLGGAHGLYAWRMGEAPPPGLAGAAPFDAVLALGNVWPQILAETDARATAQAFRGLLRPGGLLLLGLKAFGVRLATGDPYLPLLRRERAGRPLWFVRFLDFTRAPLPDGTRVAGFHMAVVAGDAPQTGGEGEAEALLHRASLSRIWDPAELGAWWRAHGFEDVRVSASLADPDAVPRTEDVFVHARAPLARVETPANPGLDSHSVRFFEAQFQRQVAAGEFALNPFETLALEHLRGSVLDLGCGLGNLSLAAARRGHPVVAVDASPTAIQHVREQAQREGLDVRAVQADLADCAVEGRYDTVVSIGLLMFFARERALGLLDALREAVAPGGRAIVNVLIEGTTYRGMFDPGSHHLFRPGELECAFAGWKVLVSRRDSFPAPDGTKKEFLTVVVERPGVRT